MTHCYRRIIRVRAEDSPNVRLGLAQERAKIPTTNEILIPGLLSYSEYLKRRQLWDKVQQCIGLDGAFYDGAELLLFPSEWLNRAERFAESMKGKPRQVEGIGIDTAEGGDRTAMAAVDRYGVIELVSRKTPNTAVIKWEAIEFIKKHKCPHNKVLADRGGGGKHLADALKEFGYSIKTVGFGEPVVADVKRGMVSVSTKVDLRETKYAYKNRRAQMYGELSELMDPAREMEDPKSVSGGVSKEKNVSVGFGIPAEYHELRKQLAPIPKLYDGEGRLRLPPKHKKSADDTEVTLMDLIGHSPDEADAVVLAVHSMLDRNIRIVVGGVR